MDQCADIRIGSETRLAELKRISIGYELVTNPSLLLLDEPTSGLDSVQAFELAKLLKKEGIQRKKSLQLLKQRGEFKKK